MSMLVGSRRRTSSRVLLAVVVFIAVFPVYWIAVTSVKTPREVIRPQPTILPRTVTLQNYADAIGDGAVRNLYNSLVVSTASTALSVLIGFAAAYALARHRFAFRLGSVFLIWVLLVKILPPMVLAVPLYELFSSARLTNSLFGLVLVNQVYTLPYALWILVGFIRTIPQEIEEAAEMDGASPGVILTRVVVPLAAGGIAATSIFSALVTWDEFLFALLFLRRPDLMTMPVRIARYITEYETLWGPLMAIGLIATVPLLLLTGYVYRRLTEGFSVSLR